MRLRLRDTRVACRSSAAAHACAFFLFVPAAATSAQSVERALAAPVDLTATIAPEAEHPYLLNLSAGERVHVYALGPALWLRLFSPDGTWIGEGMALGAGERASVDVLAEVAGRYRLVISAPADAAPVEYRLHVERVSDDSARARNVALAAATAWLAGAARPLHTLDPAAPLDDLAAAADMFDGVRVVGLGEAIHGAREFQLAAHRLARFLVEHHGFSVFALETSEIGAAALNDYVLHGVGDPAEALAGQGIWIWDTADLAALISWLREHNLRLPLERRVRFAGFDMQYHPGSRERIVEFLAAVAPHRAAHADSLLAVLTTGPDSARLDFVHYYTLAPEQKAPILAGMRDLHELIQQSRAAGVQHWSHEQVDSLVRRTRLLEQFAHAHSRPGYDPADSTTGVATRDRYLAENVLHLMEQLPAARVLLYSHNQHVRRDPFNMGYYLGRTLGDGYYALGVGFDRGSFQALQIGGATGTPRRTFDIGPAFQGSAGWFARRAGMPHLVVDFRRAPAGGPGADWLAQPLPMRSIGFGYAPGNPSGYYRAPVVLGRSFDGLLFIGEITPARSNPSVRR